MSGKLLITLIALVTSVNGDRIVKLGDVGDAKGREEVDANGMAVAPGFIKFRQWPSESIQPSTACCADRCPAAMFSPMGCSAPPERPRWVWPAWSPC